MGAGSMALLTTEIAAWRLRVDHAEQGKLS
jgi:hypothetical protein